jgi:hypothetical protein
MCRASIKHGFLKVKIIGRIDRKPQLAVSGHAEDFVHRPQPSTFGTHTLVQSTHSFMAQEHPNLHWRCLLQAMRI